MSATCVLITGASGYLGRRIADRVLATSDSTVVLTARSAGARESLDGLVTAHPGRVTFVELDLTADDPLTALTGADLSPVTHVVHAAAVTRFNVERELARRVNVDGTRHVLALAARCPQLESFAYVSTLYSTGLHAGPLTEQLYDDAGFANSYEWSKWAAEQHVSAADLPSRILRVTTVVADDASGAVTQYNAFHETLKLCFYGLLSLLPGSDSTPLYLVTGDFAAEAVVRVLMAPDAGGVFHVTHDRAHAATLGEVLDIVFRRFDADEDFRRKRILRPLLADQPSFDLLVDGVSPMAGSVVTQALTNVAPFAHQLYVDKEVDTARLRAVADAPRGDVRELVAATADVLVRERWGRRAAS